MSGRSHRPRRPGRPRSARNRICFGGLANGLFKSLVLLGLMAVIQAQAPLIIENLTDKSTYDLRVWFRVPSAPGHRYQVVLDGRPVPTDLTNWVEAGQDKTRWGQTLTFDNCQAGNERPATARCRRIHAAATDHAATAQGVQTR